MIAQSEFQWPVWWRWRYGGKSRSRRRLVDGAGDRPVQGTGDACGSRLRAAKDDGQPRTNQEPYIAGCRAPVVAQVKACVAQLIGAAGFKHQPVDEATATQGPAKKERLPGCALPAAPDDRRYHRHPRPGKTRSGKTQEAADRGRRRRRPSPIRSPSRISISVARLCAPTRPVREAVAEVAEGRAGCHRQGRSACARQLPIDGRPATSAGRRAEASPR